MKTPTSKEILDSMGTKPTVCFLAKEISEVIGALIKGDLRGVVEEIGDALFFFWALMALWFGADIVAIGTARCWKKVQDRRDMWRGIFRKEGLVYHPRYTSRGTNYNKSEKIKKALELAR